ncbi:kinase-like domain-containing protein [Hysterangium stoloniferum]|nr:kinase-like domain-containing protein [Hysterangium stoloniferum]
MRYKAFLHSRKITHGDIRAENALVSETGVARLTDFGFSKGGNFDLDTSPGVDGPTRWMFPELMQGSRVNGQSDIWAFGMTVLEIMSRKVPYAGISSAGAITQIVECPTPPRPQASSTAALTDYLWDMCKRCWKENPNERLPMEGILRLIERL